jgi:hypothetical protein
MPHPVTGEPLGQDEKDKLGAEQHARQRAAENRNYRRQTRGSWTGDDLLEGLDKDALLAEAELRRVEVKTSASKDQIVKALRAVSAELDQEG